tara:strand:- start:439 stop:762 length:324 start_codon:yes stop_codon:yes gene_type:complete
MMRGAKSDSNAPFWVKSISTAQAMQIDTPETGVDTFFTFEAIASVDEPIEGEPGKMLARHLPDVEGERFTVVFKYETENMTVGQRMRIVVGVAGLYEIDFWECGQDG